jgi:hypothetical protein
MFNGSVMDNPKDNELECGNRGRARKQRRESYTNALSLGQDLRGGIADGGGRPANYLLVKYYFPTTDTRAAVVAQFACSCGARLQRATGFQGTLQTCPTKRRHYRFSEWPRGFRKQNRGRHP